MAERGRSASSLLSTSRQAFSVRACIVPERVMLVLPCSFWDCNHTHTHRLTSTSRDGISVMFGHSGKVLLDSGIVPYRLFMVPKDAGKLSHDSSAED